MKSQILIVDDDADIRNLIATLADRIGCEPVTAASGKEALVLIMQHHPDLVVLDIMMEDMDGLQLLETMRIQRLDMPVILLSAIGEDTDKVTGFGLGADDYVTKPFSPVELTARMHAHLRRSRRTPGEAATSGLRCNEFYLDIDTQTLYRNSEAIPLSMTETLLLSAMMKEPNKVITKDRLFHAAWQHDKYDENSINVYMNRLRHKIENNSKQPVHLQTIWGIGYRFVTEA